MNTKSFLNLLRKKSLNIILIFIAFLAIAAVFTFTQPLRYEAKNKVLIEQDINKIDPYNIFKINEYYGNLISGLIYSDSFFNQVIANNENIDESYFNGDFKKQSKIWEKSIGIETSNSGIVTLYAYHPNPEQATEILKTANNILIYQKSGFQTINEVEIKAIDHITVSNYPVKPNIIINFAFAIVVSLIISLIYLYYFSEQEILNENNNQKNYNAIKELENVKEQNNIPVEIMNNFKNQEKKNTEKNIENERNDVNREKKYNTRYQNNYHKDSHRFTSNKENDNFKEKKEVNLEENTETKPYNVESNANINNLFK